MAVRGVAKKRYAFALGLFGVLLCPAVLGPLVTSDGRVESLVLAVGLWGFAIALIAAAALLLCLPPPAALALQRGLRKTLLLGLSLAVALALAETCLRVLARGPHEVRVDSHEFPYVTRINSEGFRDRERVLDKRDGVLRVLAIGDSFVYGTGVADAATIPTLLEQSLSRELMRSVEVYNLGTPGHDTHQYLLTARRFVEHAPDLVTYWLYVDNDIAEFPPPATIPHLVKNLALVTQAQQLLTAWQESPTPAGIDPAYADLARQGKINPYLFQRAAVGDNHAYYEELTRRFETVSYTRDNILATKRVFGATPMVLVLLPSKYQVDLGSFAELTKLGFAFSRQERVSNRLQQAIVRWAESAGIPCIDVLPGILARQPASYYFPIDDHFNAEGNRRTAELVSEWIVNSRLVPSSRR